MQEHFKVLHIITLSEWGGAQKYVYYLATRVPKEKYRITVTCGGDDELIDILRDKNVRVIPQRYLVREINPIKDFLAFIKLYKLMRREKVQIVHCNSSKAGILGRLAAKLAKIPVVIFTAHGLVINEPMHWLKRQIFTFCEKIAGRFSDAIITVSEYDKQTAIKYKITHPKKIIIIHNGLDIKEFFSAIKISAEEKKKELELEKEDRIVGIVANFYPVKGLKFFIQAARYVSSTLSRVKFVIVGDGKEREMLQALVRQLNLEEKVLFLGYREDVPEILQIFDVFVLSSLKEGFPFTILEAMITGLPIVATRVGGIPEVIQHTKSGLLVPPGDSQELAKNIISLLKDKSRAEKIALGAKKRILSNFVLDSMLKQTEELYQELLAKNL